MPEEKVEHAKDAEKETAEAKQLPKIFMCELCDVSMTSELNLRDHLQGARHMKKFMSLGNNPETAGMKTTAIIPVPTERIMPQPPKVKQTTLDFTQTKEPIIGLQFIVEQESANANVIEFKCGLCRCTLNIGSALSHVVGYKHRAAFLERFCPNEYNLLSGLPKSEQTVAIQRLVMDAMNKFGRGKVKYLPKKRSSPQDDSGSGKRMRRDDFDDSYADGNSRNRGQSDYSERRYSGYGADDDFPSHRMAERYRGDRNEDENYVYGEQARGALARDSYRDDGRSAHRRSDAYDMLQADIPTNYPIEKLLNAVERKFRLPDGCLGGFLPVLSSGVVVNEAQAQTALDVSNGLTQALLKYRKQRSVKEQMPSVDEKYTRDPDSLPTGRNDFRRSAGNNTSTALFQSAYNMHTGYSAKKMGQNRHQMDVVENYPESQFQETSYQEDTGLQQEEDYYGQQEQASYQMPQQQLWQRNMAEPSTQQLYSRKPKLEQEHSSFAARSSNLYSRY